MKNLFKLCLIAVFTLSAILSFSQDYSIDPEIVYKIKQEVRKNSQIEELSFWFTDFVGPRVTASQGKKNADAFAKKKMEEMGFENVVIEEVRKFDRGGWDNLRTYIAMTQPYYANFAATPKAWTGSTEGEIKGSVVLVEIKEEKDFEKYKGQLAGKIVLIPSESSYEPSFEAYSSRHDDESLAKLEEESYAKRRRTWDYAAWRKRRAFRTKVGKFLKDEGVAVVLNSSGKFNVVGSGSVRYKSGDPYPIPEVNLPLEAHGRMQRLLKHNVDVQIEVDIKNQFIKSPQATNVMAEIPGTDPELKDEIVLIGGHYDSWHGGTGAADNASGCIVMMEALRILKALDIQPRRTIRVALWGGEEQGLNGSRGYVEKYLREPKKNKLLKGYEKFAAYFNMDNGTGKFRGIYCQENEMVKPIFEEWIKPFESMGMTTVTIRNTGGTDHLAFNALGLPAFQFIQDRIEYGRGYHSNMDTYERLIMGDLKHNSIVVAAFVYQAAMRDEMLPRKPYEAPKKK